MSESTGIIPAVQIETAIIVIRNQRVIVDADLARLYGVSTKRLNEQVKRNLDRFPPDFMFQLTATEKAEVVANCDHLANLKFSTQRPYAFTEHGAIMAANVLNSTQAVQASVLVVRAFVRLRQFLATHREFSAKFDELEKRLVDHDEKFAEVFGAIRHLIEGDRPARRKPAIGYQTEAVPPPKTRRGRRR